MIPLARKLNDITDTHMSILKQVVMHIKQLPDDYNCHQVCEYIATKHRHLEWWKGHIQRSRPLMANNHRH